MYTLDGEPITWREFLEANQHELPSDQIQRAAQLQPGESMTLGGGAGAEFVLARVLVDKGIRKPDTEGFVGRIGVKSLGPGKDDAHNETLVINRAHDMTLALALARRGYDVSLKFVGPEEAARRQVKFLRGQKRRAALREGK